jgi:hypothetical protein
MKRKSQAKNKRGTSEIAEVQRPPQFAFQKSNEAFGIVTGLVKILESIEISGSLSVSSEVQKSEGDRQV